MCTCTDNVLCPKAEAWWVALNIWHENKLEQINTQSYRETKINFTTHRTNELREKGLLSPGATTGYQYYADWREQLLPTWKEKHDAPRS